MSAKKDQKKKLEKLKKLKQSGGRKKRLPSPQTISDKSKDKKEQKNWNEVIQELWGQESYKPED
jgi:hypothetical protein